MEPSELELEVGETKELKVSCFPARASEGLVLILIPPSQKGATRPSIHVLHFEHSSHQVRGVLC